MPPLGIALIRTVPLQNARFNFLPVTESSLTAIMTELHHREQVNVEYNENVTIAVVSNTHSLRRKTMLY